MQAKEVKIVCVHKSLRAKVEILIIQRLVKHNLFLRYWKVDDILGNMIKKIVF